MESAFCRNTNNAKILLTWARAIELQSQKTAQQEKKRLLLLEADKKLHLCLELNPKQYAWMRAPLTVLVKRH